MSTAADPAGPEFTVPDPTTGLRGVYAALLVLEAIVVGLALLVLPKFGAGATPLGVGLIGGSIGLALMATLQDRQTFLHFNRFAETVSANATTTQEWFMRSMAGPAGEPGAYRQLAGQMLQQATVMAYNDLFFALGVAIAITTPLALFLRPIPSGTQMAMH